MPSVRTLRSAIAAALSTLVPCFLFLLILLLCLLLVALFQERRPKRVACCGCGGASLQKLAALAVGEGARGRPRVREVVPAAAVLAVVRLEEPRLAKPPPRVTSPPSRRRRRRRRRLETGWQEMKVEGEKKAHGRHGNVREAAKAPSFLAGFDPTSKALLRLIFKKRKTSF